MFLSDIVNTSQRVAETRSRLKKVEHLSDCLRRLSPDEIGIAVAYLSGELCQGRIGLGPAALGAANSVGAADSPRLTLAEVDQAFERIATLKGSGSAAERARLLAGLFATATREEQGFLARLIVGELRQGALGGIMTDAIARASGLPLTAVRTATMLAGNLAVVALAALTEGSAGLRRYAIELLRPVQPMLAQSADDVNDALDALGRAALEYKMDGARVQVHKAGDEVRVFSRRLNEVTAAVPELVEAVRALAAERLILDGEAIALGPGGSPMPFQTTMRRFGRRLDVAKLRRELPLSAFFFDALHQEGEDLIAQPTEARFKALSEALPASLLMPRLVTADKAEARSFLDRALQRGHEGVMAKSLDAAYEAGSRGSSWLKVKPAHTLDLVVLAAEWGHGRRSGWLSNLHLGACDPVKDGFVMLGKTFKGMTDEMLAWQTQKLQQIEVARDAYTVYVRPELVVEVAFNDIQASPQYPGGVALRFARVKRYRPDKRPEDADTLDSVLAIYRGELTKGH